MVHPYVGAASCSLVWLLCCYLHHCLETSSSDYHWLSCYRCWDLVYTGGHRQSLFIYTHGAHRPDLYFFTRTLEARLSAHSDIINGIASAFDGGKPRSGISHSQPYLRDIGGCVLYRCVDPEKYRKGSTLAREGQTFARTGDHTASVSRCLAASRSHSGTSASRP